MDVTKFTAINREWSSPAPPITYYLIYTQLRQRLNWSSW